MKLDMYNYIIHKLIMHILLNVYPQGKLLAFTKGLRVV